MHSAYAEVRESADSVQEESDGGNHYDVPDISPVDDTKPQPFVAYESAVAWRPDDGNEAARGDGGKQWKLLEPTVHVAKVQEGKTYVDVYRALADADAQLVKAAVQKLAQSLPAQEGTVLLRQILEVGSNRSPFPLPAYDTPVECASLFSEPTSRSALMGGFQSESIPLKLTKAPKNTKWNELYRELLTNGLKNMSPKNMDKLLKLANDFVYTCATYTKVIVNEFNMPNDKKTIKPAAEIGGLAGGEKYIVQGTKLVMALGWR